MTKIDLENFENGLKHLLDTLPVLRTGETVFSRLHLYLPYLLFYFFSDELATAILKTKSKPNRLMVEEATTDDNSVVTMSPVSLFYIFTNKNSYGI